MAGDGKKDSEESTEKMKGTEGGSGMARVPAVYRLSSSDNPGNIITTCRLNGDNYLTWSKAIRMALNAKHKLPFIDGTIPKPEDEETRELWESCNSTLISWIFNTMEEDLQSIISGATDVKAMWDELRERYSQGNLATVYDLKSRLAVHKQNGQSVQKYYGKFKQLWQDLDNYAESPKCTCGNCTCEIGRKLAAEKEKEKGLQFLMGLDPEFATVRSNLLGMEPLPSLNSIYSKVTLEEKSVAVARSRENKQEATAFVAKAAGTMENVAKTGSQMPTTAITNIRLSCNFCGKTGHTRNNCWALHGLPAEWGKDKKPTGSAARGRWAGKPAGQPQQAGPFQPSGHQGVGPGRWKKGQNRAHVAKTSPIPGISDAQFQQLCDLFGKGNDTETLTGNTLNFANVKGDWILDTGASRHMSGQIYNFSDHTKLEGQSPVFIPNGGVVQATCVGTVELAPDILLSNVLYIPSFNCNLISIARLIEDWNCDVIFCSDFCVIQDRTTRTMSGVGKLQGGVYNLRWVAGSSFAG